VPAGGGGRGVGALVTGLGVGGDMAHETLQGQVVTGSRYVYEREVGFAY
jgi:hypothetical protein